MKVTTWGTYPVTIGTGIAAIVLILAILGLLGVLPFTDTIAFAFVAALAAAILL